MAPWGVTSHAALLVWNGTRARLERRTQREERRQQEQGQDRQQGQSPAKPAGLGTVPAPPLDALSPTSCSPPSSYPPSSNAPLLYPPCLSPSASSHPHSPPACSYLSQPLPLTHGAASIALRFVGAAWVVAGLGKVWGALHPSSHQLACCISALLVLAADSKQLQRQAALGKIQSGESCIRSNASTTCGGWGRYTLVPCALRTKMAYW